MSYQTGSATDVADVLDKLAVWLASITWTVDNNSVDGAGRRLHAHKSGVYVNLRAALGEAVVGHFDNSAYGVGSGISIYLGNGYSAGSSWKLQPGGPVPNGLTYTVGATAPTAVGAIVAYHFFSDATDSNIIVVIERTSGIYTHFGWGLSLNKRGTWTGGPYFYGVVGSYHASSVLTSGTPGRLYSCACPFAYATAENIAYVLVDVDAFTSKWVTFGVGSTTNYMGYTGKSGWSTAWYGSSVDTPTYFYSANRLTNQLNGQSLLLPIHLTVNRDAGGASFIGDVPNVFLTNACAKGFTPGSVYAWGLDNYVVFPGPASGAEWPHCGFAVKKV